MKLTFYTLIIVFISSSFAFAQENAYFLTLKYDKVNVRYGPNFNSPIKYIYKKKNLPVKIIDKKENFRRIVDLKKNSGWIHRSQLKKNNSFITLDPIILFSDSTKFSRPIVKIETGRLLSKKKCNLNWCKVETGKYKGWVLKENLWGLN